MSRRAPQRLDANWRRDMMAREIFFQAVARRLPFVPRGPGITLQQELQPFADQAIAAAALFEKTRTTQASGSKTRRKAATTKRSK